MWLLAVALCSEALADHLVKPSDFLGLNRPSEFFPMSGCQDAEPFHVFNNMFWRCVLAPLSVLTCSPCRVWPASASRCAPAAAGRSRTATICWPWTNSGTCAASSAASANSTWSPSSPASARTVASTARRTTTGRDGAQGPGAPHVHDSQSGENVFKIVILPS